jgi:hypothetical protein
VQVKLHPPTVRTGSASSVTAESATLSGTVNANGLESTVWFEYGTSFGSYSNTTSTQTVEGRSDIAVTIGVSGLTEKTVYYFRIVAENLAGTTYGSVNSFTTPAASAIRESSKSINGVTMRKSVAQIRNILAIAGGGGHTLCLRSDGSIWSCGSNYDGQLGHVGDNGEDYADSSIPANVGPLSGIITSIAGGNWHTVALRSDGTVWTWGGNYNGQLGDGTNNKSKTPVQVKNFNMGLTIGRIYGYVVDLNGDPLISVNLRLAGKKTKTSKSTLSDKNGYFEFKDLTADTYGILAKKKGYNPAKSAVVLQTGEIKEIEIEMSPKKGNGSSATPTPLNTPTSSPTPMPSPSATPSPTPSSTPAKVWQKG